MRSGTSAIVLVVGALALVAVSGIALVIAASFARISPGIARFLRDPRRVMRAVAAVALIAVAAATAAAVLTWNR